MLFLNHHAFNFLAGIFIVLSSSMVSLHCALYHSAMLLCWECCMCEVTKTGMVASSSFQTTIVMFFKIVSILGNIDLKSFQSPNDIYWQKNELYCNLDMIYFARIDFMLRILKTIFCYIIVPIEGPDLKMLIFPAKNRILPESRMLPSCLVGQRSPDARLAVAH